MKSELADELLDSKTCFSKITLNGKLIGYELNDLLISIDGKLVVIPAVPHVYEPAPEKVRMYANKDVLVNINQKSMRKKVFSEDYYRITERASFFIKENGKKRTIKVSIESECSP